MIASKDKWDVRFLRLAREVATWSKDPSTQTGAVYVRPDRTIASVGYNGFPRSMEDRKEWYVMRQEKYSRIIHCEVNALINARDSLVGSTLYTYPFLSCDRCAVTVLQAGVLRFVAPQPTANHLERWGDSFYKARQYINECGGELVEIEHDLLDR